MSAREYELPGGGVLLDFNRDWCPRHMEPLRETWSTDPSRSAAAMLKLFEAFAVDERVQKMAPLAADGYRDAAALPRLVAECSPLCCFLGDEVMDQIMQEVFGG